MCLYIEVTLVLTKIGIAKILFLIRNEVKITDCIATTHALARELLSKPDGFLTAMYEDREYVINDICRVKTHANIDDSVMHWTIKLRDGGNGNILR